MNTELFQKKVRAYSHLPEKFLQDLAGVADRIPSEQQEEILADLSESEERELQILTEGYRVISEVEKSLRKDAEEHEHTQEIEQAETIFTEPSPPSL